MPCTPLHWDQVQVNMPLSLGQAKQVPTEFLSTNLHPVDVSDLVIIILPCQPCAQGLWVFYELGQGGVGAVLNLRMTNKHMPGSVSRSSNVFGTSCFRVYYLLPQCKGTLFSRESLCLWAGVKTESVENAPYQQRCCEPMSM